MDYGAKISSNGQDVKSFSGNSQNLLFNTQRNCLKVAPPTSTTVTTSGGSGSVAITHGLAFRPVVVSFLSYNGGYYNMPTLLTSGEFAQMYINAAQVIWDLKYFPNGTYTIYYYLSQTESAA